MIPDNVNLIVKAPDQRIEDQNIICNGSWTVRELKDYLSSVYPSKPKAEAQKIIYSGQLLNDSTILKDVLRTSENQTCHIMHLVCKPTLAELLKQETEGLRHRNVNTATQEAPRPETRQNDQNHTMEMQNYLSSYMNNYGRVPPYPANFNMEQEYLPVTMPNDPVSMANQMMMMQQAYLQYMQQYASMWQATNGVLPGLTPTAPEANAAPAPQVRPPQDNDDDAARDWLDYLYAGSRAAILVSLVYLYGSPARLLLVLIAVTAGYLHQIGFFRELNVNPAPVNPQANAEVINAAAPNEPPANVEAPNVNIPAAAHVNLANGNDPIENVNQNIVENNQSLLAVTWMIVTSFFTSLIPEPVER